MKTRRLRNLLVCLMILAAGESLLAGEEPVRRTWEFDRDTPGQLPVGFSGQVGQWSVVASDSGNALAQSAKNANPVFNLVLVVDSNAKDLDLSVRMKSIAGELDQGGGFVWRARDAKNYYLARYNPLEDNFRVYKVVDGKRTQLESADVAKTPGWRTIRVTMSGDKIECFLDGTRRMQVSDATFTEGGQIGLWTKSDAQSRFDDLTLVAK